MEYRNTTNIPTALVAVIAAHAVESVAQGIELNVLELVNKKEGLTCGQFGWYFPIEKRVKLIVPTFWHPHSYRLRYLGAMHFLADRVEWIVSVLSHEMRHAWQWQMTQGEQRGRFMASKNLREYDAEFSQARAVMMWREKVNAARAAHSIKE